MNLHKIIIPTPYAEGDVNAFLLKGDTLTLFDAGPRTDTAYNALKKGIEEAGYKMEEVEQVVLTHHHPDHAGWVDAFPQAEIIGHEYVDHFMRKTDDFMDYHNRFYLKHLSLQAVPQPIIEKILNARGELELFGTMPLTKFINEGDEVPGHPGLKTYYTPGHAQSHLIFLEEATGEVIGGDLIIEKVAPNPLVEPPVDLSLNRPKSMIQQQQSLLRLRELQVTKVYSGHGNDIMNVSDLIDLRLERDHSRARYLLTLLNKPKTILQLTMELYPAVYKKQFGLTLSKTLGYLDCLVRDELVNETLVDGVAIYNKI